MTRADIPGSAIATVSVISRCSADTGRSCASSRNITLAQRLRSNRSVADRLTETGHAEPVAPPLGGLGNSLAEYVGGERLLQSGAFGKRQECVRIEQTAGRVLPADQRPQRVRARR